MNDAPCTVVVAVDRRTVGQLEGVWPTWRLHRPELFSWPIVVICDTGWVDSPWTRWWHHRLRFMDHSDRHLYYWHWRPELDQRERMLSAFVKLSPLVVQTPYWLKLDTDVYAHQHPKWYQPEWFEGDPALVAPPWHYTKPAEWPGELDRWAKGIRDFDISEPLNLPEPIPGQKRIGHIRICSWCCYVRTDFSAQCASYVKDRLPVPSHDTYHWYCAYRLREPIVRIRFKKFGWDTITSDRKREHRIQQVLDAAMPPRKKGCCE